jgi:hypothetical protein
MDNGRPDRLDLFPDPNGRYQVNELKQRPYSACARRKTENAVGRNWLGGEMPGYKQIKMAVPPQFRGEGFQILPHGAANR